MKSELTAWKPARGRLLLHTLANSWSWDTMPSRGEASAARMFFNAAPKPGKLVSMQYCFWLSFHAWRSCRVVALEPAFVGKCWRTCSVVIDVVPVLRMSSSACWDICAVSLVACTPSPNRAMLASVSNRE